jgi:hypothetical protein
VAPVTSGVEGGNDGRRDCLRSVHLTTMSCADLVRLRAPLLAQDRASTSDVVAFCKYIRDAHIRDEQGLIASHGLRIIKGSKSSIGTDCTFRSVHLLL